MRFARLGIVSLAMIGWLGSTAVALAAAPRVNDEAKFFTAGAIERANQKIREIERLYHKDVLIETVPSVPSNLERHLKQLGKKEFFIDWARQRAEDAGVKGIYILLCKNPGHMQIEVDRATLNQGFTNADREELVRKMTALLSQNKNDAALLDAVNFIDSTLRTKLARRPAVAAPVHALAPQTPQAANHTGVQHLPVAGAAPASAGSSLLGWLGIGLAILLGVWLVSALFRALTGFGRGGGYGGGPMGPGAPGGYGYGGGGGGFFSSLLGGMFGATAGMWLYNNLLGGGSNWGSSSVLGNQSTPTDADTGPATSAATRPAGPATSATTTATIAAATAVTGAATLATPAIPAATSTAAAGILAAETSAAAISAAAMSRNRKSVAALLARAASPE